MTPYTHPLMRSAKKKSTWREALNNFPTWGRPTPITVGEGPTPPNSLLWLPINACKTQKKISQKFLCNGKGNPSIKLVPVIK